MAKLRIGIVGCGAIGTSLAKAIRRSFPKEATLVALYDIDLKRAQRLSKKLAVMHLEQLINKSDLVIEAASAQVSWRIARDTLIRSRDILVMSVGGLIGHLNHLAALAKKYKAKVYIPSGAISGIDALKAARMSQLKKVILTTRKNPASFKGIKYVQEKGIKLDRIRQDKVLFYGRAKEAVKNFPQNINVAAVLSLAGIGQDKTRVKIIASPKIEKNIHEIKIESSAGNITTRTENVLHPKNPKTSFLAVLSAIAVLKQILEPIRIGT